MMRQPKYVWVSVAEAAERLGVSVSTVRRMVEDGKLVGEREPLGGSRERYRVRFDAPETHQDASPSESDLTPDTPPDAPATPQDASLLLDRLEAAHERERAQADRIAALERENGRLESTATHAQQAAENERQRRVEAEALAAERERELER